MTKFKTMQTVKPIDGQTNKRKTNIIFTTSNCIHEIIGY